MSRSVLMLLGTYSPAAHRGIARYAAEHGWHLHVDMARIPVIPRGWTGDGIIAGLGEWEAPLRFLRSPALRHVPVVDIFNIHPEIALPRVVGDHLAIGRLAAEHFLERGWRRFAWFSRVTHPVAQLRLAGFERVLNKRSFTVSPLVQRAASRSSAWTAVHAGLVAGLKSLEAASEPLAVFAYNDFDAALVMSACMSAGCRVPEDVGLLGVDDNELVVNSLHVPLSSVRLDLERIGYEGAAMLDVLMQGGKLSKRLRIIPHRGIAVRASTDTFAVNHPAVREALRFIGENLDRSLGVDEIAAATAVSRRTLEDAFQKELNQTIHEKVMQLRINRARELLLTSSASVQDISAQCGFCNAPHLHRVFKKQHGQTPRHYRMRQAKASQSSPASP